MKEIARANDFLRNVSDVIGHDVDFLELDALDNLLGEHHVALLRRFSTQSEITQDRLDDYVARHKSMTDHDLRRVVERVYPFAKIQGRVDGIVRAMRRSGLIRIHLMRARIEEDAMKKTRVLH